MGLNESDELILKESGRAFDKVLSGDEICIENNNQIAVGLDHGMIEITRFGVAVIGTGNILASEFFG